MRFTCNQNDMTKALNIVSKAVTVRSTIPILKGILLEATADGKLIISASDLDISIQDTIEVEVDEPGSMIVMAKKFSDIIRKLPGTEVEISTDENNTVTISSMNSVFNIVGVSGDEFPVFNAVSGNIEAITLNKKIFKEMIEKTSFAASSDESRGIITGVLIESSENEIRMIAIDGFRMAINRRISENSAEFSFVVPAKILNELAKIINDSNQDDENCALYLGDKKAIFNFGNIKVEMKLLEGKFIAYNQILPKSSKIEMIVNRRDFMEGIDRASLLSMASKNNLVKMNIKDTILKLTSDSEEGNVKEEIIVNKNGDDLDIGFNSHYLTDVLKSIDDEEVKMLFNSGIDPCLVKPIDGNDYEYLILPVRIN